MDSLNRTLAGTFLPGNKKQSMAELNARAEMPCPLPSQAAIDHIWLDVRDAATDVAMREVVLQARMQRLVLDRTSLADVIAEVLSDRLISADICQPSLYSLISEVIDDEKIILQHIAADLHALKSRDPACLNYLHGLLNMKGFHALETYRIAHSLWLRNRKELAFALSNKASAVFCVDIHPAARIGSGVMLDHGSGIVIGETAVVDDNVSMLQNVTLGGTGKERGNRHPKVRCGVMIGVGAKILGNIEIGTMSKIGAGSVVLEEVPPHCTVAGVPARIVRRHHPVLDMDQSVEGIG